MAKPRIQADVYYEAYLARDPRFDGKFYIGVKTTGIYCRPICPARPKRKNVEFFAEAHEAERAGYRPCLRCRPECAPRSAAWAGKSAVVQRALRMIAAQEGAGAPEAGAALEADTAPEAQDFARGMRPSSWPDSWEERLAHRLGLSARHLRRLFEAELGRTPKQLADAQRLGFARTLLVETGLPITEIAFSAGFASIRRFNAAFKARFDRAPRELRRQARAGVGTAGGANATSVVARAMPAGALAAEGAVIRLSLAYRPPLDWESALAYFRAHEIHGVERVGEDFYERVYRLGSATGALRITRDPKRSALTLEVRAHRGSGAAQLQELARRARQMFDLDSDPAQVQAALSRCPKLRALARRSPGLRLTAGFDPFEVLVCAILGQLVSVEQGRRFVRQLVEAYGERIDDPLTGREAILFPRPEVLARASLAEVGLTQARKVAIREASRRVASGKISLHPAQDSEKFRAALLEIPGIGPWTADYVRLRALADPDAFPRGDLVLKRALRSDPAIALEEVRPWRAYSAIHLWHHFSKRSTHENPARKNR